MLSLADPVRQRGDTDVVLMCRGCARQYCSAVALCSGMSDLSLGCPAAHVVLVCNHAATNGWLLGGLLLLPN